MATAQQIQDYARTQGYAPDAAGKYVVPNNEAAAKIYGHAQAQGYTAADLDSAFGWNPGDSQKWITDNGMPSLQAKPTGAPKPPDTTGMGASATAPSIPSVSTGSSTTTTSAAASPPDMSGFMGKIGSIFGIAEQSLPTLAPAAQIKEPKPVNAVTASVPYSETTGGIIERLMKDDSPYLERARAMARDEMNGRGLLSSSIAVGAATGAAIDRAGEIASTDAGIYANQRIANMNAENEVANANANRSFQAAQFNASAQNDFALTKFNAGVQIGGQILGSQLKMNEMSFDNLMQMDRMKLQNEFDRGNLGLQTYLDMVKAGYQSDLNKGEMGFGSSLRKDEASYASGLNKGEMAFGSSLKKGEMEFGSGLTLKEMGYGAQLDLMKLAAANGYDVQKMAIAQGYTLEQMSQALGFDLQKMQAGNEMDLQKMAVANGYDTDKMALDFGYKMQLNEAAAMLDADLRKDLMTYENKLGESLTGRGQLAGLASQFAAMFDANRNNPDLDQPTKDRYAEQIKADFRSQVGLVADLYSLDATTYLDKIGAVNAPPAVSTGGNANGADLKTIDPGWSVYNQSTGGVSSGGTSGGY